jgi:hypothetical protein
MEYIGKKKEHLHQSDQKRDKQNNLIHMEAQTKINR